VVDAAATTDGDQTSVFLVNRSQTEATTVTIDVRALAGLTSATAQTIADDDIFAANTLTDQNRVSLVPNESIVFADGTMEITLPPVSWTAVSLS
jgi:alpha-N-arabinofuranosidase